MIKGISNNLAAGNRYTIRFAQSEDEIRSAQQLRFEVFNLELGEGLAESFHKQLDIDEYDEQCHHLLVIEREKSTVVGTYRMQTYELAQQTKGFYTAGEYDLSGIPESILKKSVEVGRACIDKGHRNGRVLYLLWRGLAEYLKQMNAQFLFGCCSITSQNSAEAWLVMEYLKQNNCVHPDIYVDTNPKHQCKETETEDGAWKDVELPQLFRLYMDLGAKVCSPPAMDREFKTIDYLILLDVEKLDERTRLLFFK